jgi:hypothetical protein
MSDWKRFSRLPQSDEYYGVLASRMQQSLHDVAIEPVMVRSLAPLAWTAIAAALVAVMVSARFRPDAESDIALRTALVPADSIGAQWSASNSPPSIATVLMGGSR